MNFNTFYDFGITTKQFIEAINLLSNGILTISEARDYIDKKQVEPFIVSYRSKPIRGITLELVTMNSEYIREELNNYEM